MSRCLWFRSLGIALPSCVLCLGSHLAKVQMRAMRSECGLWSGGLRAHLGCWQNPRWFLDCCAHMLLAGAHSWVWEAACLPWLVVHSIFKANDGASVLVPQICLLSSSALKGLLWFQWPIQVRHDNFPTLKSLISHFSYIYKGAFPPFIFIIIYFAPFIFIIFHLRWNIHEKLWRESHEVKFSSYHRR